MASAMVLVCVIGVGRLAPPVAGIRQTHRRLAAFHSNPVGPWERPEIRVERAVLLHDHDDVLDLVNAYPARRRRATLRRGALRGTERLGGGRRRAGRTGGRR